jgi:hypothetical protein
MIRQVILDSAPRRKDGSVAIRFTTDLEQTGEEFMEIDNLRNQRGILYFSTKGELTQAEIDAIDNTDIELQGKTKSQRMKAVLHVLWTQRSCSNKDSAIFIPFEQFYASEMERIIQHYKDKLEER